MTEAEKNEIVGLVMTEISSQAVDFDITTEQPKANDLLTAVRESESGGYVGVTLKWDDVARIATELANQAATRAEQALSDTTATKTEVDGMKASVEQTVTDFNALAAEKKAEIEGVYQSDLNELKGDLENQILNEKTNRENSINELKTDLETERNARIEADTEHSTRLQNVELASSVNRYEIENLKAKAEGQIYREEIVDGEAYSLDVPSSVSPYAELQKIGGKSVVWNQIIQIKDSNYSYKGITYTKQADGTFLANGTSTASGGDYINKGGFSGFKVVSKHKYYIWGSDYGGTTTNCMVFQIKRTNGEYYVLKQTSNLGIIYTSVDLDDNGDGSVFYFVSNGTTLTNVKVSVNVADLTQMFGLGNEPTLEECKKIFSADYYPYDTGTIKSFPVKRVKSVGRNLWDEIVEIGGISSENGQIIRDDRLRSQNFCACSSGLHYILDPTNNLNIKMFYYDKNKTFIRSSDWTQGVVDFPSNVAYFKFVLAYTYGLTYKNNVCINKSDSLNGTYTPYMESVLDLSSVTEGMKSAGSVADEWKNGKVTKKIGVTKVKNLNLQKSTDFGGTFVGYITDQGYSSTGNCICGKLQTVFSDSELQTYDKALYAKNNGINLYIRYDSVNGDVNTLLSLIGEEDVYYQLATPTEESVPEIAPFVQVEGGGSLTFESDDTIHMPVPSTTRFVVDLT